MNKKSLIACLLVTVLAAAAAAWAINQYIISEPVDLVFEEYILTLEANATHFMIGEVVYFNGTLTSNGYYFQDVNITLWRNGTYTGYSTKTVTEGYYEFFYNVTDVGNYRFVANATII